MQTLKYKLSSRKFLLALASAVAVFVTETTGVALSSDAILGIGAVVLTYIGGEAYVDAQNVKAAMQELKQDALTNASIYIEQQENRLATLGQLLEQRIAADQGIDPAELNVPENA